LACVADSGKYFTCPINLIQVWEFFKRGKLFENMQNLQEGLPMELLLSSRGKVNLATVDISFV
jgi:hypothetical protein